MDRLGMALLVALLSVSTCTYAHRDCPDDDKKTTVINILHTNDVHARFDQASRTGGSCSVRDAAAGLCYGGAARIATAIKAVRAEDPEALYLDAGDQYTGTMFDTLYRGNITGEFLNALGANAVMLGNHEFDFRVPQLVSNLRTYNAPVLGACNIDASRRPELAALLRKWVILEVKDIKIAIVGVLTEETNTADLIPTDNITVTDEIEGLKKCVADLKQQRGRDKPDIVVVLSHIGYDMDKTAAAQVAGIDLIIGGHSHTFLYGNGSQPGPLLVKGGNLTDFARGPYPTFVPSNVTAGKVVPVATAYYASRYLGRLKLTLDKKKRLVKVEGQPLLLGGSNSSSPVAQDPEVAARVAAYGAPISAFEQTPVGSAKVDIRRAAYGQESAIGKLAVTSMLSYWENVWDETKYGPLFIALQNSGGLRADLAAGPLTVGDVFAVQPFGNLLAVKQVNGHVLYQALENGFSALNTPSGGGRFPQLGGLRVVYDATKAPGQRVVSVKVERPGSTLVELDTCQTYNLASFDYVFSGGDGYSVLADNGITIVAAGPSQEVPLIDYVRANSPLEPKLYGLIKSCGSANPPAECSAPQAYAPCSGTVNPKPVRSSMLSSA